MSILNQHPAHNTTTHQHPKGCCWCCWIGLCWKCGLFVGFLLDSCWFVEAMQKERGHDPPLIQEGG